MDVRGGGNGRRAERGRGRGPWLWGLCVLLPCTAWFANVVGSELSVGAWLYRSLDPAVREARERNQAFQRRYEGWSEDELRAAFMELDAFLSNAWRAEREAQFLTRTAEIQFVPRGVRSEFALDGPFAALRSESLPGGAKEVQVVKLEPDDPRYRSFWDLWEERTWLLETLRARNAPAATASGQTSRRATPAEVGD